MKKLLLALCLSFLSFTVAWAQCVPSCSVYATSTVPVISLSPVGHNTISFSNTDDATSAALPIGFTFTFFCNAYTQFVASTNGFISFDLSSPNGCCAGVTIPTAGTPNDFIALSWNDLNLVGGGAITYTTIGTAPNRQCIITYTNVGHHVAQTALTSGHIILYETTNEIEIHSVRVDADNNSGPSNGTQGIENSTGTLGYASPGFNAAVISYSNIAYKYFAGGAPTPPIAITGNTVLCAGALDTYLATTMPGASSYAWSFPAGWVGTSTTSIISPTAGVSGNLSVTATYSCGTSAPTTLYVSTIPAPVVGISATPPIICSGQVVTINGTGTGVTSYTLFPDGLTGTPPFTVMPGANTVYSMQGENVSGCFSNNTASLTVTVKSTPTVQVNSGSICLGEPFTMTPTGAPNYNYSSIFATVTPSAVGVFNYSVTGTNSTGCVSDPAVSTVTVNALPNVTASANRLVICAKESVSLTAGGASTYTWANNSSTSSGFTVIPASTTIYTVTGTQAGCAKSATIGITVNNCVGLNEMTQGDKGLISIYPNPSNGEFTIKSEVATHIVIYDMIGKTVFEGTVNAGTQKIDLNNYPSGQYLLKATSADGSDNKVIIKR